MMRIKGVARRTNRGRVTMKSLARKPAPPEKTQAETAYYAQHRESMTPMVVVLVDGEELFGIIKWYDRAAIKLLRDGRAELMIPKRQIKYVYEDDPCRASQRREHPN